MNKIVVGIVILVIVLSGGYFVAKAVKHSIAPARQQQSAQPTTATKAQISIAPSAATQEITVIGNEFAFTPSSLTVKQSKSVAITFKNTGKYPHNFTITDLNVQTKTINPGQQDTVTFTPSKTGSFSYICTVPGHADKGMKGTIIVQ